MRYLAFLLLAVLASCDSMISEEKLQEVLDKEQEVFNKEKERFEEVNVELATENLVSFKVDSVEINYSKLPKVTYADLVEKGSYTYEIIPMETDSVTTIALSFQNLLHVAYSEHRPIILTPEDFWLLIAKNASIQINNNYDSLKEVVFLKGLKQDLIVRNDELKDSTSEAWSELINAFALKSEEFTTQNAYNFFSTEFSTTDINEKVAMQSVLMESFKKGITFIGESGCGFPKIIVEGSAEDWQLIIDRIVFLDEIGMKDYRVSITPHLQELKSASLGNPNVSIWKDFYKDHNSYGETWVNGWVTKFYYFIEGTKALNNEWEDQGIKAEYVYYKSNFYKNPNENDLKIEIKDFFSMQTNCPIIWNDIDLITGETKSLELMLIGGHMGSVQSEDGAIRSLNSWIIRGGDKTDTEKRIETYRPRLSEEQTEFIRNY